MTDLRLGDCLDVLRSLPDASVDVVVTSPPYNQLGSRISGRRGAAEAKGFHGPGNSLGMHRGSGWVRKVSEVGYADDRPEPEYQRWLAEVVAECLRVSKGLVWVNHKIRYRDGVAIHPARFLPFPIHSEVVWARAGSMALNCRRFAPSHECLWAFGRPHWWDSRSNRLMSVWKIAQIRNRADHPCPFPGEIAARPIAASCPPGGIVLDPFMGSGTTGEEAVKLGRRFMGIEQNPEFYASATRRIEAARDSAPLFRDSG